jgi:hypothetical protein
MGRQRISNVRPPDPVGILFINWICFKYASSSNYLLLATKLMSFIHLEVTLYIICDMFSFSSHSCITVRCSVETSRKQGFILRVSFYKSALSSVTPSWFLEDVRNKLLTSSHLWFLNCDITIISREGFLSSPPLNAVFQT